MQFINYLFASLVSFFGLAIGILLIKIAPEEQKPLKTYLATLRRTALFFIFIFLAAYYLANLYFMILLLILLALILAIEFKLQNLFAKSVTTYPMLGIIFFLSKNNINLFVIESSLIFIYGAATASLIYERRNRNHFHVIFYNAGFLAIANFLYFVLPFLMPNS